MNVDEIRVIESLFLDMIARENPTGMWIVASQRVAGGVESFIHKTVGAHCFVRAASTACEKNKPVGRLCV